MDNLYVYAPLVRCTTLHFDAKTAFLAVEKDFSFSGIF